MSEQKRTFDCPYCGVRCLFEPVLREDLNCSADGLNHLPWACQNCFGIILTQRQYSSWHEFAVVPGFRRAGIKTANLPQEIRRDYLEALSCFAYRSFTATAILCRRTIQQACDEKGAAGKNLFEQIEALPIDDNLKRLAHKIRFWGNEGAHPDLLMGAPVSEEDADTAIGFVEKFLQYVYVIPAEINDIDGKLAGRQEKKQ